ncbi:signal peptide peptidase SppA [Campylobacter sp. LR185c]|uniref:signal peptide peptidase SppA n=1 Tax=Campylobacter sp. LR185c TaxID=2014525 RepID=UPI0012382461|nr:signal peptide peptidase SppA [Campylobacter sp. LR185c]KAA6227958.1 signal peptide peptidase SppA [Campylobacter sp. LR185c]KAA8604354.1 signal peptide peptidase SppA [Campylobacter sp. LR185c]
MQSLKGIFSFLASCIRYINTYFKTFVFLFIVLLILMPSNKSNLNPANLIRLDLKGAIIDSSVLVENIYKAKNDNNIKGVLLVIDSPGGTFGPSMEIALAIEELSKVKKVVAYTNGTMASGSYLGGVSANKILANPASFIGSIGVIMQGADISELANKIGIKEQSIQAGTFKSAGTITRPWKDEEKAYLQDLINQSYELFTDFVANKRKLNKENKQIWADARVFLASRAKELGLIDDLTSYEMAKKQLQDLANVVNPIWQEESKFEKFLNKISEQGVSLFSDFIFKTLINSNREVVF